MDTRDIVALVTGANRGIGRAIVQQLLARGAKHVYAASRTPLGSDEARNLTKLRLDVTKPPMIEQAAARCADVNVLINNAGVLLGQSLLAAPSHDAAEAEMRVNYFGTLQMCRAFAPVLAHNGGGAIVNVLSILARVNLPAVGSYSASKAAMLSLMKTVALENRDSGVTANVILPGTMDTPANRMAMPGSDFSKWVNPANVASLAVWLASDAAQDVNGAAIPVYGNA